MGRTKKINVKGIVGTLFVLILVCSISYCGYVQPREAGLAQVCWSQNYLAQHSNCDNEMSDLRWHPTRGDIPLTVAVMTEDHSSSTLDTGIQETRMAIEAWNTQMGFELFRLTNDIDYARVVVSWNEPGSWIEGGETTHRQILGQGLYCRIKIQNTARSKQQEILVHQLGHAIGLSHDTEQTSIMYPYEFHENESCVGMKLISQYDKELLKELYND
jgi:hypothetical protein